VIRWLCISRSLSVPAALGGDDQIYSLVVIAVT
jgi:hypothetical protein